MRIRIGHLYPDLMNIYADRGNILCLTQRLKWRGIDVSVDPLLLGQKFVPGEHDLLFMGGGQDREQCLVAEDFENVKGTALNDACDAGVVILAVCGGYQLMGHSYRDADGAVLPGVGLFDAETIPAPGKPRIIGNVVVEASLIGHEGETLVGFENHGGRTHLGPGCSPLGRIVLGGGNNGDDGNEGAVHRNAFGTYLHGSLLPKNPWFADLLLQRAARRHEPDFELSPLDDTLEHLAHAAAVQRAHATL